eukprot:2495158-Rhodomonas_salina.6
MSLTAARHGWSVPPRNPEIRARNLQIRIRNRKFEPETRKGLEFDVRYVERQARTRAQTVRDRHGRDCED